MVKFGFLICLNNITVIHNTKLTKGTMQFLRYLYYNITLSIPTCFNAQESIIMELVSNNIE